MIPPSARWPVFSATTMGSSLAIRSRAAAVIIHVASLDEPPLRLLLGSDAVHSVEQADLARIEADKKWRDLSVSTDFAAGGGSKVYPWERK
jgi:hypothetical protein